MTSLHACNYIVSLGLTEYEPGDRNKLENMGGLRIAERKGNLDFIYSWFRRITLKKAYEFKVLVLSRLTRVVQS